MKEVSIDIDGTLANSMALFMRMLRKEHGIDMRLDEVKRYNLQKATGIPKTVVREMFSEIWSKPESIPLISKHIPSVVRKVSEEMGAALRY